MALVTMVFVLLGLCKVLFLWWCVVCLFVCLFLFCFFVFLKFIFVLLFIYLLFILFDVFVCFCGVFVCLCCILGFFKLMMRCVVGSTPHEALTEL